ncbi:MAG: hypothetical protein WEA56_16300 [Balneolaceae bacterium]
MSKETVREGQWIYVGENRIPAYVINVISEEEVSAGYYQNDVKAIKENFVLVDDRWEFKHKGPNGTYLKGTRYETIVKRGPYY